MAEDERPLSLLARAPGPAYLLRVVRIAPFGERRFDAALWRDALVVVERGVLEVESLADARQRFESGAIVAFVGLSLRVLRNVGGEPVVLTVVSRRRLIGPRPARARRRPHPAGATTIRSAAAARPPRSTADRGMASRPLVARRPVLRDEIRGGVAWL